MRTFKKAISALLTLAMILSMCTFGALATESENVAKIGDTGYPTLAAAIAAVSGGETVTLIKDASGDGVRVPSGTNFTLDLGGFTYTVNGQLVGSTGTETLGFQLLKDSNITIKNGAITTTNAKMLIQNYSNLTLENVTLTGASMTQYVLSNNNGSTKLGGTTNITAADDNVAFDVYYWPNNGYTSVSVEIVDSTVVISGKVEYAHDNTDAEGWLENAKLTIPTGYTLTAPAGYGWATKDGKQVLVSVNVSTYDELAEIIGSISDGGIITLTADITNIQQMEISKAITIDMNGFDISGNPTSYTAFKIVSGGELILDNSASELSQLLVGDGHANEAYFEGIRIAGGGEAVVKANVSIETGCPVFMYGNGTPGSAKLDVYGKLLVSAPIDETEAYAAIQGNGSAGKGGTVINIYDGAEVINVYSAPMYIPQDGVVNVYGGTITGKSAGIALKSGILNIYGGTISATGEYELPTEGWSNGINASGAAIQIESNGDYSGGIDINITGGTITSANGYSIYEYLAGGTAATAVTAIDITGGSFSGAICISEELGEADKFSITGGSFNTDPSDYVPNTHAVSESGGWWTVAAKYTPPVTPVAPPVVTVPVNSESGSANVSASISGTEATVSITDDDLNQVISSGGTTGNVTIDISALDNVDSAVIPSNIITAVNEADDATGLTIALSGGSLGLDNDALAALAAEADGAEVIVSVEAVKSSDLSSSQQAILGNQLTDAVIVDVSVLVAGNAISDFGGGTLTITIPYIPAAGVDTSTLVIWYLADDGSISPMEGAYDADAGAFIFTTSHLSAYALVSFPFVDVAAGSWYYGHVAYTYNQNLFSGTSATTFSPNATTTRAMLMTIIARLAGQDTTVESGPWYEKGMNWAKENGISDGTDPDGNLTREQLATMLYRYAGSPEAAGELTAFSDAGDVSEYALPAIKWAVEKGLITGMGDGTLNPQGNATRAQLAAILTRLLESEIQ